MIASYSGMTTIRNAYNFAVNNGTAAVLVPLVCLQMRQLVATCKHLMSQNPPTPEVNVAGLGDNFPFCKAVNLPGSDLLNTGNFPELCYAAWFKRTMTNKKFKQVKEPECTNKTTLRAYTSVCISRMGAAEINDADLQELGMTREQVTAAMDEVNIILRNMTAQGALRMVRQ